MQWFQNAAYQGDLNAKRNMAEMYKQGYGVAQDYKKSKKLLEEACKLGSHMACMEFIALVNIMLKEK